MKERIIRTHILAIQGASTAKGGVIQYASGETALTSHKIVRVGDLAVYPDGSLARVVSGCGAYFLDRGMPLAIIGSALHNGDVIVDSPQSHLTFHEIEGKPIEGLLQRGWHRFVSRAHVKFT